MANDPLKGLTKNEQEFVKHFVQHGSAVDAFKFSYNAKNSKIETIYAGARRVKTRARVEKAISEFRIQSTDKAMMNVREVFQEWVDIATADPNELVSHQRRCCRHCYGRGHRYQWKDEDEFSYALGRYLAAKPKDRGPMPDDEGGFGFNFTYRPHPECTECQGEGHPEVFIADTRALTGKARKLYAGIKQTANGMQVLMRDQDAALLNIAKALGMHTEKIAVTGADGGPLVTATLPLPTDPIEAANLYAQIMKSGARK